MVEEFDPLEEDQTASGRESGGGGHLLDLPLGGEEPPERGEPAEPPPGTAEAAPPPAWEPRHRRRRAGRRVRPWLWVPLLLAVAAGAWYFWPRGAPARIEPSLARIDFGARRIAVPGEPIELSLTNLGERQLRVRRFELVGDHAQLYQVVAEACVGRRVASGESCTVAVDYLPRESGAHRAALRVVARAANGPMELPLSGSGVAPRLALDPQRFGFEPLRLQDWVWPVAGALAFLLCAEAAKLLTRGRTGGFDKSTHWPRRP